MNPPLLTFASRESICVSGELSFQTVTRLALDHDDLFRGVKSLTMDLKAVERADSAGLALLIDWLRQARREQCVLHFENIPVQMLAIARISGVDGLLSH